MDFPRRQCLHTQDLFESMFHEKRWGGQPEPLQAAVGSGGPQSCGISCCQPWLLCPLTDQNASQMETAHFLGAERREMAVGETVD